MTVRMYVGQSNEYPDGSKIVGLFRAKCRACGCHVGPDHVPHSVACREARAERDQSRTE